MAEIPVDDALLALLTELVRGGKLVATLDEDDAPFRAVTSVTLSAALPGETRRVILWLDDDEELEAIYDETL